MQNISRVVLYTESTYTRIYTLINCKYLLISSCLSVEIKIYIPVLKINFDQVTMALNQESLGLLLNKLAPPTEYCLEKKVRKPH